MRSLCQYVHLKNFVTTIAGFTVCNLSIAAVPPCDMLERELNFKQNYQNIRIEFSPANSSRLSNSKVANLRFAGKDGEYVLKLGEHPLDSGSLIGMKSDSASVDFLFYSRGRYHILSSSLQNSSAYVRGTADKPQHQDQDVPNLNRRIWDDYANLPPASKSPDLDKFYESQKKSWDQILEAQGFFKIPENIGHWFKPPTAIHEDMKPSHNGVLVIVQDGKPKVYLPCQNC